MVILNAIARLSQQLSMAIQRFNAHAVLKRLKHPQWEEEPLVYLPPSDTAMIILTPRSLNGGFSSL